MNSTYAGTKTKSTSSSDNISIGWTPKYVEVVNDTTNVMFKWFTDLGSGKAFKIDSTGTSNITTNGISGYSGSSSAAKGFTIGSNIASGGDTVYYIAHR